MTDARIRSGSSTRPARTGRRRRALAAGAALLVLGGALAACTTSRDQVGAASQGIGADSVKVGYTIVDLSKLNLGFKKANYGGVAGERRAIEAVVAYVNAHGGAGGRRIEPVVRTYLGSNDNPTLSQAQCSAYTQDDRVFAVVMDGQLQTNGIPCYRSARTILLDETLVAHDQTQFEDNAPYLWSPTHPEYASFVEAQLGTMKQAGFFDGGTGVLVMPSDDEVSRRVTETVVRPFLASAGVSKVQVSYVDSTNVGTLGTTSIAAVTAGKNLKLDRVLVVGGARIEPIALAAQVASDYPSRWGISTFDNPQFNEMNSSYVNTPLLSGQVGLGYDAFQDVSLGQEPPLPDPANPAQVLCHRILTEAGAAPPAGLRLNWSPAMQYCDATMFLKAVLDQAPKGTAVTGAQFKDAAGRIGATYRSAATVGSQWRPGVFAGTNAARELAWVDACMCYRYSGDLVTFDPTDGSAAPVPLETITVTP